MNSIEVNLDLIWLTFILSITVDNEYLNEKSPKEMSDKLGRSVWLDRNDLWTFDSEWRMIEIEWISSNFSNLNWW